MEHRTQCMHEWMPPLILPASLLHLLGCSWKHACKQVDFAVSRKTARSCELSAALSSRLPNFCRRLTSRRGKFQGSPIGRKPRLGENSGLMMAPEADYNWMWQGLSWIVGLQTVECPNTDTRKSLPWLDITCRRPTLSRFHLRQSKRFNAISWRWWPVLLCITRMSSSSPFHRQIPSDVRNVYWQKVNAACRFCLVGWTDICTGV